jgi:hypothetical protein
MPKVSKIKSQIDFISAARPNLDKNRKLSELYAKFNDLGQKFDWWQPNCPNFRKVTGKSL